MNKYLFVLSPPRSGSTILWRFLGTSENASIFPREGQLMDSVRHIMKGERWDPEKRMPWRTIKREWDSLWDQDKPVLLEKSPPNLLRAAEIEKVFVPSYFIVMIRNPYAYCEGVRRRRRLDRTLEEIAEHWITCAEHQKKSIATLSNVIHFTYETFVEKPGVIREEVMRFVPELTGLDWGAVAHHSSVGRVRGVRNLNRIQIRRLSAGDISRINNVLRKRSDLMEFFGYEFIRPNRARNIGTYTARCMTPVVRFIRTAKAHVTDFLGNV